jgi:hypothetical protein
MDKLKLICQIQARLSGHRDLYLLRPRVALSFNEEEIVVQYQHPLTRQAEVMVAGSLQEAARDEHRLISAIVDQLRRFKASDE